MKFSFKAFTLIQEMGQEDREKFKRSVNDIKCAACIKEKKDEQKAIEKVIELLVERNEKKITASGGAGT